ncbi:ABC transporter permease subunit [Beduinella massiliensis]|uniref:ABC transporter permease subunit n=1 Tax=Beduinella massiliensis TaxID=1852363 RepID=UPI000C8378DE
MVKPARLSRGRRALGGEGLWGAVFLLPTLVGFLVFTLIPVVMSLVYSFTKYDGVTAMKFIGLKNYTKLLGNKEFIESLWHTLYFAIGTVPVGCFLALFVAVVLNQKIRGKVIYRACFFIPSIVSMVAIAVVFQQMFNKDYGVVNQILGFFGVPAQGFFASTAQAMPCVIFVSVWKGIGVTIVIFLAGLTGVDPQLYEAADIDGAGAATKFFRITLPMMRATLTFVLINNTISSFQAFDQIYMLTSGGPAKATQTLSYLIYANAFQYWKLGYASAIAYIMFAIILVISILQLRVSRDEKN